MLKGRGGGEGGGITGTGHGVQPRITDDTSGENTLGEQWFRSRMLRRGEEVQKILRVD